MHNIENLEVLSVTTDMPTSGYEVSTKGSLLKKCSYVGSSLILKNKITLRHYFIGDISGDTMSCKNITKSKTIPIDINRIEASNVTYVDIVVPYTNISDMYELAIDDNHLETYTLTYGVLTYYGKAYALDPNSDLVQMCQAMYNFSMSAKDYYE